MVLAVTVVDIECDALGITSDVDETYWIVLVESDAGAVRDDVGDELLVSEVDAELVVDVITGAEDEAVTSTWGDDESEGISLVESDVMAVGDVVGAELLVCEVDAELVADGTADCEGEAVTSTSDDDETNGNTLVESYVWLLDDIFGAELLVGEVDAELVPDAIADTDDEAVTSASNDDTVKFILV